MERKMSKWLVAAAAVAMAAPVSFVLAQGPKSDRPARGEHGRGQIDSLVRALELTEDQQTTWKQIHEKHQAENKALREQGRTLHQELRKAADAPSPDPTAVGKAFLSVKHHQEKMKASREALKKELEATLTPEQKTKFEAIQALREDRRGKRGSRGPRGMSGAGRPGDAPDQD